MSSFLRAWWKWEFIETMRDRFFSLLHLRSSSDWLVFQALLIVNNRSLEDALAIIFGEAPSFSSTSIVSASGASVEQATQVPYQSVGREFTLDRGKTKKRVDCGEFELYSRGVVFNVLFRDDRSLPRPALNCRYDLFLVQNVIPTESDTTDESMMTYRMLFVVNGSLRMSSGKMAAQVAHCAVDLYQSIVDQRLAGLNFWRIYGQTKIVVRGESTEELLALESRALASRSIATSMIRDAGLTEIASGSVTCLGLFATKSQLEPITGHLKLMSDCLNCSGAVAPPPKSKKGKREPDAAASSPTTTPSDMDGASNT